MAGYLSSVAAVWKPLRAATAEERVACSCSPSDDGDDAAAAARSFCSSLSARVGELGRSLGEGPVSLRWSAEAMRVLRWTQAELLDLSRRSNLSDDSVDEEEGWLHLYMEDAAALLDLCNRLRSAATAIASYRMTVDLAIQRIENGSPPGLESLEVEHQKVPEATRWSIASALKEAAAPSPLKMESPIGIAALAARCANVAISSALMSAFVSPVSVDMCEEFVDRKIPEMEALESAAADLVGRVRERIVAGSALAEEELVRASVSELIRQLDGGNPEEERGASCMDVLRRRSAGLKEAIEAFCEAAGQVFDEVCRSRNELLGTLGDRRLQSGS